MGEKSRPAKSKGKSPKAPKAGALRPHEQRQKDAPATLFRMEENSDRSKMEGIRREVRSLVEMLSQPPGAPPTTTKRRASGRKASKNPEDSGNPDPPDRLF